VASEGSAADPWPIIRLRQNPPQLIHVDSVAVNTGGSHIIQVGNGSRDPEKHQSDTSGTGRDRRLQEKPPSERGNTTGDCATLPRRSSVMIEGEKRLAMCDHHRAHGPV